MLAAACGSDSDDSSTEAAEEPAAEEPAAEEPAAEEPAAEEPAAEEPAEEPAAEAGGDILVDVGVDDETIKIGLLTDLTGAFAPLTVPITDGSEAYFEWVNANGGIAGRQVEVITLDTGYDVPTHQQQYDTVSGSGADGVVFIATSTGSPHTASIRSDLVADGLGAIPLSWNSSWPDPASSNAFEWTSNYCVEAMNGVTYMSEIHGPDVAVLSWPGDYGEDGAIGAKYAVEQLGLNLVYDGQGAQAPTSDPTPVIAEIIAADPDFVWITTNPTDMAAIVGGAAAAGYTGQWAGNGPTYNPALLGVEGVSTVLDASYTHFQPYPAWDTGDSEGMAEIVGIMQEYRPDAALLSVYINSYIMGEIARQGLEAAAANGDMTRQGVVDAITGTEVDLKGLAAPISYSGDPNDFIARESFIFDISLDAYTPGATVSEEGSDGAVLLEENYISPTAAEWDYEACFPI
jgi:ABC-type branched-subunit amino acid transport system substrate-binding protein